MMEARQGELTLIQKRRLEAALRVYEHPNEGLAYQHAILCQTSLPYSDPGESLRVWERRNGQALLLVEAGKALHPRERTPMLLGLPFGPKPRLILAYLNSEALRTGSPEIDIEGSLTGFVKRLGLAQHGRNVRTVRDQLARLAAARFWLGFAHENGDHSTNVDTKVVAQFDLWLNEDNTQKALWPTKVRLADEYYRSLSAHAVPLHETSLAALSNSPMALDIYAWLAHRLHRIPPGKPQDVSWVRLHDQFGSGFKRLRKFRETFLQTLQDVHAQYRSAKIDFSEDGLTLYHSQPPVAGRVGIIKKDLHQVIRPVGISNSTHDSGKAIEIPSIIIRPHGK